MEIHKDMIFKRFDAGLQIAGIARHVAAEQMSGYVEPTELFAEYMENGNVRVWPKPRNIIQKLTDSQLAIEWWFGAALVALAWVVVEIG